MNKPVQLFMNIYDIKPHEPLWEFVQDKHDPPEDWDKEDLIKDIRKHGFKYQLNVDPDGNIRNGNARYWVARYLLEEEGDERFRYLPVQRNYAAGMYYQTFIGKIEKELLKPLQGESKRQTAKRIHQIGQELIDTVTLQIFKDFMNTKDPIIPCATEFEDYELDPDNPIFLKRHWEQSSGEYTSFVQRHPKEDKLIFALILEGHRTFQELLEDERMRPVAEDIQKKYAERKDGWVQEQLLARIRRKERQ